MSIQASLDDDVDAEIIAQTVRYARAAAPGTRASRILAMLKDDFPEVEHVMILRCMKKAADLLLNQHN